jgi:hypothetical protein
MKLAGDPKFHHHDGLAGIDRRHVLGVNTGRQDLYQRRFAIADFVGQGKDVGYRNGNKIGETAVGGPAR